MFVFFPHVDVNFIIFKINIKIAFFLYIDLNIDTIDAFI